MKTSNKRKKSGFEGHQHHTKQEGNDAKDSRKAIDRKMPGRWYPVVSTVLLVLLAALVIYLLARPSQQINVSTNVTVNNIQQTNVEQDMTFFERIGRFFGIEPKGYSGDKVTVEFYVMSQCPYGTQVEDAIFPVLEKMGDGVDFQLNFIVKETAPGVFQSLHGEKEVRGNIAQLCAKSYYPEEYMDMIICQNKDVANVDTNWESCGKELGMDTSKLKGCIDSDEGKDLLRTSMQRTMQRGASGSPTMYFADVLYSGPRDAVSFQREICKSSEHPACGEIPECASDDDCTAQTGKEGYCINPGQSNAKCEYKDPVEFGYIILNDDACTTCDPSQIVQVNQQLFLGAEPRLVDVKTEEGKALVEKYKLTVVPVYIYEPAITTTRSWQQIEGLNTAFEELPDGSYRLMDEVTGANYFVSEEARKAHYDAIGVVLGDNKPQIDFFIMSYCPYGNQAEIGIEPVYRLLKDKAIFNPRYVIYENYGGGGPDYCLDSGKICSMHGIQELNQNIREACAAKYFGTDAWFDFALAMNNKCTYQNADSCWEAVATELKLDVTKIKACEKDEGVALMRADKELGDKLGVSGSPTVFIDGQAYNGGRTPEAYKTGLCAAFTTAPAECSTALEGSATATASGSC